MWFSGGGSQSEGESSWAGAARQCGIGPNSVLDAHQAAVKASIAAQSPLHLPTLVPPPRELNPPRRLPPADGEQPAALLPAMCGIALVLSGDHLLVVPSSSSSVAAGSSGTRNSGEVLLLPCLANSQPLVELEPLPYH
jgi:hypothetical protein